MPAYWKDDMFHCDICKCWVQNNKACRIHHERGERHKRNVELKIKEIGKKASDKEKSNFELNKTLQMMEAGAVKAAKRDAKMSPQLAMAYDYRMANVVGVDASTSSKRGVSKAVIKPAYTGTVLPESAKLIMGGMGEGERHWVEALSEENGRTYFWNAITGVTTWEPPPAGYYTMAEWDALNNKILNDKQCTSSAKVEPKKKEPAKKEPATKSGGGAVQQAAQVDPELAAALQDNERKEAGAMGSIFGAFTGSSVGHRSVGEVPKSNAAPFEHQHTVMHAADVAPIPESVVMEEIEKKQLKDRLKKVQSAAKEQAAKKSPAAKVEADEPDTKKSKLNNPYGAWTTVTVEPEPEPDLNLPECTQFRGDEKRLEELDDLDAKANQDDADECKFEEKKLTFSLKPVKKSKVVVFKKRKNLAVNVRGKTGD